MNPSTKTKRVTWYTQQTEAYSVEVDVA